ncbi:MAG: hypothetical protein ACLPX5_06695 [Dissulfurispiraceae bacterium]
MRKVNGALFDKDVVWESSIVKKLKAKVDNIVQAGISTLLIMGESEEGKELIAPFVHYLLQGACSAG